MIVCDVFPLTLGYCDFDCFSH